MKHIPKWLRMITILFLIANVFIFINRSDKFEYVKYSDIHELYPEEPDTPFLIKWNRNNQSFSRRDLDQGISILKEQIRIDTILDEKDKVLKIAIWLYKSFYQQQGIPDVHLSTLNPLQQYNYLKSNKEKKLWCGYFQRMYGFFCTSAGLQNRYVEIVPVKSSVNIGYHEVNEVYLPGTKKWIMVDVSRNLFLIFKNNQALSAAQYLNYRLQLQPQTLLVTYFEGDSIITKSQPKEKFLTDIYFNKNYFLRYYLNLSLSEVYSPVQKIKRYIFADPWYEIYSPGLKKSNLLFRVKQFFFFGFLIAVLLAFFFTIKNKRSDFS